MALHPPACQGMLGDAGGYWGMQVEPLLSGTPMPTVSPPCHQRCLPPQPQKFCRGNFIEKNCSSSCLYKHSALLSLPELSAGLPQGICEIRPAVICNNIGIKLASLSCRGVSV